MAVGIFGLWARGESLEEIAYQYDTLRERIRAILTKAALDDSLIEVMPRWRDSRHPDDDTEEEG